MGRLEIPTNSDVVCLPYLIDGPDIWETMLVRIIDAMHVGQRLVLLTQISPCRDPRMLVPFMQHCGIEIQNLQLEMLPYSFSRPDAFYVKTDANSLIIEATKTRPLSRASIDAKSRIAPAAFFDYLARPLVPGQRHAPFHLDARERQVLVRALAAKRYDELIALLEAELGSSAARRVIALLGACQMLALAPRASRWLPGRAHLQRVSPSL